MRILMFYHAGSKNRGCEAIVRSAIPIIQRFIPNAQISLASLDHNSDKNIPGLRKIYDVTKVPLIKYSIHWLISSILVKFFKNENYFYRYENQKLIKLIPQYDMFLSIGGDNYCYGEQPWLYEVDRCIKKAGKKLVLWGASIGEEDLSLTKIEDLKSMNLLLARETYTYNTLVSNGIENVHLCADGAFTMGKEELALPQGWVEGNTLGFNFSPLVFKKNPNSKEASFSLIQHILDTTTMAIALTPHVIEPGNDDYESLLEFYEKFKNSKRVFLLPNNLNALQYKGYIARMRFFIGARTHATIAAYSNFVPTMVLGYSVKSKGIAKDIFGEEKLVLPLNEISNKDLLISKFEEMKNEEQKIKEILESKIPHVRQKSFIAGEQLGYLITAK